jgi:phage-related protein
MAYTTFPSYAQHLLDDTQLQATPGVERTQMDDGFIAQAPTQTLTRYEVTLTYRLRSRDDLDAFERWRSVDLAQGARYFAWPDIFDPNGAIRRARIVNGTAVYKPLDKLMENYSATFTLEFWR